MHACSAFIYFIMQLFVEKIAKSSLFSMRGYPLSAILFSLTTAAVITPITFKFHYDCAFQSKIIIFSAACLST